MHADCLKGKYGGPDSRVCNNQAIVTHCDRNRAWRFTLAQVRHANS
jgi:hypothetical protein